ncbi:Intermediate filament protein [Entomortierella beljakovae]|nr:Intermediate filament protein [Entomortierella beljakovae]
MDRTQERQNIDQHVINDIWFTWPSKSRKTALKATALSILTLVLFRLFGNPVLKFISHYILIIPLLLIFSLLTLAASNAAFAVYYARQQRLSSASASTSQSQQSKQAHSKRTMPGSTSRHLFHYLRPAKFTRPIAWGIVEKQRRQEQAAKYRTPISDDMPLFSEAIDSVIELIMRDYVLGWMRAITPEVVLQQRLEELLRIVLINLKSRVVDVDLTQFLVTKVVPKVTAHVNDFRKAEMALRGNSLERTLTESDELDIMVAGKFRNGKLHKAISTSVSTKATEEAHLRNIVQTILPTLLPQSEVHSDILRLLLREILVCAVLRPVMELISDPDYWNQNVDLYIGKAIREQNMVKKLREALRQHTDNMDADSGAENVVDPYGSGADLYNFEDFLTMIRHCDSLLDVKRIRNTIITQIRKKKAQIAGRDKDDIVNGNKVGDIAIYINRLDIARRHAERRVEALGGPAYPKRRTRDDTPESKNVPSLINLDVVLTNPTGLSYFMEFQDRKENMNELLFWLMIETLDIKSESAQKLEIEASEFSGAESKSGMSTPSSTLSRTQGQKAFEALTPTSMNTASKQNSVSNLANSVRSSRKDSIATSIAVSIDTTDTLRDDVRNIYETYFAESAARPVIVEHSLVDAFKEFALSDSFSSNSSITDSVFESRKLEDAKATNVRQKLLEAQRQVFSQMKLKDYPEFARSDLYFKFLTSYQNSMTESSQQEEESKFSKSSSRPTSGTTLFSAIGLGLQEKRREVPENSKRSSTGSFLDIFGLGRDKDKERDHIAAGVKRSETTIGNLRPSFLSSNISRSKTSSPVSTRTIDSGDNSSQSSEKYSHQNDLKTKQSLEVSSSAKFVTNPMARTRSLNSATNSDGIIEDTKTAPKSSHKKSSSVAAHFRGDSLDLSDNEGLSKSGQGNDEVRLRDSLLMELNENVQDDEALMEDDQGGLPIPRMPKNRNGKEKVINAVEAALSSIMEMQDSQSEDIKGKDSARTNPTDPSFSTARDNQGGADALLEWGKSQRKNKNEKGSEYGKTNQIQRLSKSEPQQTDKNFGNKNIEGTESEKGPASDEEVVSAKSTERRDGSLMDESDYDSEGGTVGSGLLEDDVHLAAPGDLLISTRIKRLEQQLEVDRRDEAVVLAMIQNAEHQGLQDELRILKKSKSSLRRDILNKEYQITIYKTQEEENMILPGRSTINITSSTVGHEGSKEFALYVIEVHKLAEDGSYASGWVIARRYSEFFALNQQLREKYPLIVRQYELPGKRGFLKLQKSFVEGRRIGLERYLQCLVQHKEICQSQELRAFLSQENVALPQFSSAISASSLALSLFDSDSQSKETMVPSGTSPSINQFSFEQLFHSTPSPLLSPISTRDSTKSMLLPTYGASASDTIGRRSLDGVPDTNQDEGFMKHIYQTVSEGLDDMFSSGGPPTVLGNITKQLGDQMVQFTIDTDGNEKNNLQSSSTGTRKRHGSHGESGSQRLVQSDITESSTRVSSANKDQDQTSPLQRPPLQRIQSSRNRRLSSPDPHTQHQRLKIQLQQQEQKQTILTQQQKHHQQHQHQHQQQQQQHEQQHHQTRQGVVEPEGVTTFTEPLCDLFIELFELKEKNNWLRRQAVVIILQQVLGGTIERKLRDTIKAYIEESMLIFYVLKLRDALWPPRPVTSPFELSGEYEVVGTDLQVSSALPNTPQGKPTATDGAKKAVRTPEQKASTKDQANRKLSAFLPDLLGNMVGHQNARRGARRVFAAFQNRRLNQQLVYTTLDEVIEAMWPDLALPSSLESPVTMSFGTQNGASAASTTGLSSSSASLPPNAASSKNFSMDASTAAAVVLSATASDFSDSGERSGGSSRIKIRSNSRANQ